MSESVGVIGFGEVASTLYTHPPKLVAAATAEFMATVKQQT